MTEAISVAHLVLAKRICSDYVFFPKYFLSFVRIEAEPIVHPFPTRFLLPNKCGLCYCLDVDEDVVDTKCSFLLVHLVDKSESQPIELVLAARTNLSVVLFVS